MGFKAQPLETHKGKNNQCPSQASFIFGAEVSHMNACVASFNDELG